MTDLDSTCRPVVDTHAHLDDKRLIGELPAVLERARSAGVAQIVAIGIDAKSSISVVGMAAAHPGVFAAVGVHPNEVAVHGAADWPRVAELATHPRVVAIGETGLDRHWHDTPFDQQLAYFDHHLELAHRLDLPVVIHSRDCQRELISHLQRLDRPVHGVLHSFAGSWDEAEDLLAIGLYLSFSGMITYTNKSLESLRDVAARAPLDRLLVETDSPYLSPHPFRGKTNEPAKVGWMASRISELRSMTAADVATATSANARRLFRLGEDDRL
jgi:TatD DNase family protein